uniref:Uncharacterized protein n=1 Tax=Solanum lycopersicum TaxID=4081 RepID=A0A494G8L4_SOLLC
MTCHHRIWTEHTVERRRAWHAIITFGHHPWSNDVGCGMPSSPLGNTPGLMMSGKACHHRLWASQTVERHRAWHDFTTLGQHTRSNDNGHGMTSSPLDGTQGRTTSGIARHHCLWTAHTVE